MGRITLSDIRKSFAGTEVIHGVNLEVNEGSLSSSSARPAAASPPCCA